MQFTEVSSEGDGFCGWRSHSTVTSLKNETLYGMMRPQNLIGRILQLNIWHYLNKEDIKNLKRGDEKTVEIAKLLSRDGPSEANIASRIIEHTFKKSLETPQQHAGEIRLRAQTVLFLSNRLISFNGKLQTDHDFVSKITYIFDSIPVLLTQKFSEEEYHAAVSETADFTSYCQKKAKKTLRTNTLRTNLKDIKGYDILQLVTIEETWKKKHFLRHLNRMRSVCPFILISNICTCLEKERQTKEKALQKMETPWGVDSKEVNNSLWGLDEKWTLHKQGFVDLEHLECGEIISSILKNRLYGFRDIEKKDLLDILYFWRIIEVTAPDGFDYKKWLRLKNSSEFKTELQIIPDINTTWGASPVEKRAAYLEYLFCFKRGSLGNTQCEILTVSLDNNSTGYKSSLKSPQLPFRCKNKYLPSKVLTEMFPDLHADLFTLMSNDESLILSLGEYRNMRKTTRYMTWLGTEISMAQAATMAQAKNTGAGKKKSDDQVSFSDLTAEKQEEKLWEFRGKILPTGRRCTLLDISHDTLKPVHIVPIWMEAYCLRITCRFGGLFTIDCWKKNIVKKPKKVVFKPEPVQTNIKASNDAIIRGDQFALQKYDGRADASRKDTLWSPEQYEIRTLENPNDDAGESLHLLYVNQNHFNLLLNKDQIKRFVGGGGSGGGTRRGGGGSGGGGRGGGGRGGGGSKILSEDEQIQQAIYESLKAEEEKMRKIIESFKNF